MLAGTLLTTSAMDWLERAYEDRSGPVYSLKGSFLFTTLHAHPRFTALLRRMNLAPAGDPAPRMHRVRRDGTGLECLYEHGNDEFVVHETFLGATGDLVFVVWPFALRRMDWDSRQISTIADVTLYGSDLAGNDVSVTGSIGVTFGD